MQKQKQNWENNVEKENFLITNYDELFESKNNKFLSI